MPFQKHYMDQGEEDFTIQSQPKRTAYKKISKKLRVKLVSMAIQEGAQVSELSKRYSINYSTISYIIRSHKEKVLSSQSPDVQLKQEANLESEGEPAMATRGGVNSEGKMVEREEEVKQINGISQGVFEENQKIFPTYEMFLPFSFYFGGNQGDPKSFPFYPFFNYEVI